MKPEKADTLRALLGTLFFLVFIVPIFLVWLPMIILSATNYNRLFDIGVYRYAGLAPVALGILIYLWCSLSFVLAGRGTPIPTTSTQRLVVTGLYKYVRNPIYIAGVLVLAGEGLLFQSLGLFIYCLIMFGMLHIQILIEERSLIEDFGEAYALYQSKVPRWVPGLRPYREEASTPPSSADEKGK